MINLFNENCISIGDILKKIEILGLSKDYTIIKSVDSIQDDSYDIKELINESNGDIDTFLKIVKDKIPVYSKYIYAKENKIQLPKLLSTIGYLVDPSIIDEKDEIYIKQEKIYNKIDIILNKKFKNNLLMIGDPGVGKTTTIINYAKERNIKNMFIVESAKLIGDSSMRGSFEQKTIDLLEYAKNNNLILFFDEIHSLINLGNSIGGMSITDILKPYLIESNIVFLGATTVKESQYLMEDEAFKRRFSLIYLDEIIDDILINIKKKFFWNFKDISSYNISEEDTIKIIERLRNDLPDLYFPDKLIDFLDYYTTFRKYTKQEVILDDFIRDYIYDYR